MSEGTDEKKICATCKSFGWEGFVIGDETEACDQRNIEIRIIDETKHYNFIKKDDGGLCTVWVSKKQGS